MRILAILVVSMLLLIEVSCTNSSERIQPSSVCYRVCGNDSLWMDVFGLPTDGIHPAVLYFHGGSWISGTRAKIHQRYRQKMLDTLLNRGFVVFSVDYRLVGFGRGHLENSVDDCRKALDFVYSNATTLGVDTSQIGLWGSSAGAHLALMTVFADSASAYKVKYIIDDFGPVDIQEMFNKVPSLIRFYLSDIIFDIDVKNLQQLDSLAIVYSPITYKTNLPLLIFHGEDDNIVSISHSRRLHNKFLYNSRFVSFANNSHGLKNLDSLQLNLYINSFFNFVDSVLAK